jgi:hypothetical protein
MGLAVDHLHAAFRLAAPLDRFRRTWSYASERHYSRYLAGEISFAEQRRARVRDAIGQGLSDGAVDEILARFIAKYERCWTLFDDVLPCLQSLSGFRLGGAVERRRAGAETQAGGARPAVAI